MPLLSHSLCMTVNFSPLFFLIYEMTRLCKQTIGSKFQGDFFSIGTAYFCNGFHHIFHRLMGFRVIQWIHLLCTHFRSLLLLNKLFHQLHFTQFKKENRLCNVTTIINRYSTLFNIGSPSSEKLRSFHIVKQSLFVHRLSVTLAHLFVHMHLDENQVHWDFCIS